MDLNTNTTVIGQPIFVDGVPNIDKLYGPYDSVLDFNLLDFLDDSNEDTLEPFIGLTIGVRTSSGKKVEEYQLEKTGSGTTVGNYAFRKKSTGISSDNVMSPLSVDNSGKLYIKDASDNNGNGLFNATSLGNHKDVLPVYYAQASALNYGIQKNYLYIRELDLLNANIYQGGIGISINQGSIDINTGINNAGMYLRSTGSGVEWAKLSDSNYTFNSNCFNVSQSNDVSLKLLDAGCLAVSQYGLGLKFAPTSLQAGYLYYSNNSLQLRDGSGGSSGSYGVTPPVTLSNNTIGLQDDFESLHTNTTNAYVYGFTGVDTRKYGFYTLDNFKKESNGHFQINKGTETQFGGLKAQEQTLVTKTELEEDGGKYEYREYTSIEDEGKPNDGNKFVAAECKFVNDTTGKSLFESGRLYADLSEFITIKTPSETANLLPVICAVNIANGSGKFYVEFENVASVVDEDITADTVFMYGGYDHQADPPTYLDQWDLSEYNDLRTKYNGAEGTKAEVDIYPLERSYTMKNTKLLLIDTLSDVMDVMRDNKSKLFRIMLDLSDATDDCVFGTYSRVTASGNAISRITKDGNSYTIDRGYVYELYVKVHSDISKSEITINTITRFGDL